MPKSTRWSEQQNRSPASDRLSSLVAGQFGLATKDHPPRLGALATLAGSCPDQLPFELS
jgi:hypothetical protein